MADESLPKAPKDKNCPYCGQAFTSSSLGRHLDLYIKDKNPKPPDGVHDVDAIKKLRGSITRRQPRGSLARRATSTPAGTPGAKKSPPSDGDSSSQPFRSPFSRADAAGGGGGGDGATEPSYTFATPWEVTGVINDIPKGDASRSDGEGGSSCTPAQQRSVSRQMQKAQFEMKQKVQDAVDTARAAELALREFMGSWRAAKQHIDMHSMPFDFDPLSLDFPALTLQCLEPPPTLFSSTQHPTPASWSIFPPGHQQYEALRTYFAEEFRKWKVDCEVATTAIAEELQYPPSEAIYKENAREAVAKALDVADGLQKQVADHIQTTYSVWERLPAPRRHELWVLELARSVGKKQQELKEAKQAQAGLKRENTNLQSHVNSLNRLQQPREFKIVTPATVPFDRDAMHHMQEDAVLNGRRRLGLSLEDRNSDLGTLVGNTIERWKRVIVSTRSAQRPFDRPGPSPTSQPAGPTEGEGAQDSVSTEGPPDSHNPPTQDPPRRAHQSPNGTSVSLAVATPAEAQARFAPASATPSAPPSVVTGAEDEMSDQDADAEMEDDDHLGFAAMNASMAAGRPLHQHHNHHSHSHHSSHHRESSGQLGAMPQPGGQLDVPRTRTAHQSFGINGGTPTGLDAGHASGSGMMSRPANVGLASQPAHLGQRGMVSHAAHHGRMAHADMGVAMQGVEPMYTE